MLTLIETPGAPAGSRNQTSLAYARLRQDILNGRHAPGEWLKISDLASALEVSPGAIREALSRLIPEQLVVSRDNKGFNVAELSIVDLEELTDLRCEIEEVALRRSVARGGTDWEAAVLASGHRLRRTPTHEQGERTLAAEWVLRHEAFHAALVSASGNSRLITLHAQLYQQSERYRGLSVQLESERDIVAEHQAVVDAALDRDVELLIRLVLDHLRLTTSLIVDAARGSSVQHD
jgi:GntR family carbon starvation induced transcriptional regulator